MSMDLDHMYVFICLFHAHVYINNKLRVTGCTLKVGMTLYIHIWTLDNKEFDYINEFTGEF